MRWLRRLSALLGGVILLLVGAVLHYLAAALIGLWPANPQFAPAGDQAVVVYVYCNGIHTDLILPRANEVVDWSQVFPAEDFRQASGSHVQFGWGDRRFYVDTPTWQDLKWSTVARAALWPTDTVMHVAHTYAPPEGPQVRRLELSRQQYERLVKRLRDTLQTDSHGRLRALPDAHYHDFDAFYHARGGYHLFNTCNAWTGSVLRTSGVKVGYWTPFPSSVMTTVPHHSAS